MSRGKLTGLVMKEIADNGLDAGAEVKVGQLANRRYFVDDDGPGIDGTPEEIARLFSIRRPLVSSKLLRLPTRGASAMACAWLLVRSWHPAAPSPSSPATSASSCALSATAAPPSSASRRSSVRSAPALRSASVRNWKTGRHAQMGFCCVVGWRGPERTTRARHRHGGTTFPSFRNCSTPVATGRCVTWSPSSMAAVVPRLVRLLPRLVSIARSVRTSLSRRPQDCCIAVRANAREVNPKRLGAVGPDAFDGAYHCEHGVGEAAPITDIPFVVEAWAEALDEDDDSVLSVYVNRTPVTGDIEVARDKKDIDFFGCGLSHTVAETTKTAQFAICLNLITPFMPITSDGKAPDLDAISVARSQRRSARWCARRTVLTAGVRRRKMSCSTTSTT